MNRDSDILARLKRQYRRRIAIAVVVFLALVLAAGLYCRTAQTRAVEAIVAERAATLLGQREYHEERLAAWADSVRDAVQRISTATIVRLFVAERAAETSGALTPEDREQAGELKSYLTDLLFTVSKESGISEAYVVYTDGSPLLSSRPGSIPGPEWTELLDEVRSGTDIVFGRMRPGDRHPFIDVAAPIISGDEAVGYLLMVMPLKRLFRQALIPPPEARNHVEVSFLQSKASGKGEEAVISLVDSTLVLESRTTPEISPVDGVMRNISSDGRPEGPYEVCLPTNAIQGRFRLRLLPDALQAAIEKEKNATLRLFSCLVIILLLALFIAHRVASQRIERALGHRISEQRFLLDSINRSIRVGMGLVGADGVVRYANPDFSDVSGSSADSGWQERHVGDYLSVQATTRLMEGVDLVLREGHELTLEIEVGEGESARLFRVTLFPYTGDPSDPSPASRCVVIAKDITEFRRKALAEKARLSSMLDVFSYVVESVDSGQRGHTQKLLAILSLLFDALSLSARERETLTCAARMAPVGKIFVPRALLLKKGALTPEEQAVVKRAPVLACELIRGLNFDLPVADTVREMGERLDGSGPEGVTGENISRPARVLAVANAFCAMVSPRAYRAAMSPQEALKALSADRGLDQSVVAALAALDAGQLAEALAPVASSAAVAEK